MFLTSLGATEHAHSIFLLRNFKIRILNTSERFKSNPPLAEQNTSHQVFGIQFRKHSIIYFWNIIYKFIRKNVLSMIFFFVKFDNIKNCLINYITFNYRNITIYIYICTSCETCCKINSCISKRVIFKHMKCISHEFRLQRLIESYFKKKSKISKVNKSLPVNN